MEIVVLTNRLRSAMYWPGQMLFSFLSSSITLPRSYDLCSPTPVAKTEMTSIGVGDSDQLVIFDVAFGFEKFGFGVQLWIHVDGPSVWNDCGSL